MNDEERWRSTWIYEQHVKNLQNLEETLEMIQHKHKLSRITPRRRERIGLPSFVRISSSGEWSPLILVLWHGSAKKIILSFPQRHSIVLLPPIYFSSCWPTDSIDWLLVRSSKVHGEPESTILGTILKQSQPKNRVAHFFVRYSGTFFVPLFYFYPMSHAEIMFFPNVHTILLSISNG